VKSLTNEEIIQGIRQKNGEVIKHIYRRNFPSIQNFIIKNFGTASDAEDVFQEAMVIVYKIVKDERSEEINNIEAYLYMTAKKMWLYKVRRESAARHVSLQIPVHDSAEPPGYEVELAELEMNLQYGLVQKHFLSLEKVCRQILSLFFAGTPMKEIARIMGYKNEEVAKRRKYLCQKALIEKIRSDPDFVE
jgi:RNA polymerase sigma factor (sigma-70 family)